MPTKNAGLVKDAEFIGAWFTIELDNKINGNFSDASGLAIEVAVVEQTDSDMKGDTMTRRRPGTATYGEVTLKRTLTPDKSFYDWANDIRKGKMEYRTGGAIVLHDMSGTEMGRWTFTNAWPSKWSASDLDVGSDDLIQEEVVLQIEHLTRNK